MVKASSLFSQLLSHFPRAEFQSLVIKHNAEFGAKGFTCWSQFVAMLFCQMAHADSLREISNGLRCCLGKLRHLGLAKAPPRSSLSYANRKRPAGLFRELFFSSYQHFQAHGGFGSRKTRFRFKNKLLSLDATVISLCLSLFPWAEFRRAKGGVKVHALLDHDTYMPVFVHIQKAKRHEVKIARRLRLNPGSIVAMDMAYTDYDLFADWTQRGVFFVTRQKSNAVYKVIENRPLPQNRNILSDEIIRYTGPITKTKCPHPMRRVVVWDSENEREIVLLTNHLDFGATTIAAIYKDRWEIELFFKALKQNLKVKTFVGTSENALMIQIWTALIALLLIKWMHHLSKAGWSLSIMAAMLRLNLFTYRDLMTWVHDPWNIEPLIPQPQQLSLPWPACGQPNAPQTPT